MAGAPPVATGVTRPSAAGRLADCAVMALAIGLGGISIVLFAWPSRPSLLDLQMSPASVLWWNGLLSCLFFLQHSVMVRRSVRARLAAVIPRRFDGAFYAIASGIVLALVALLLQRSDAAPLLTLSGAPRLAVSAAALLAFAVMVWAVLALHSFDMFGTRPIREHLRAAPAPPVPEGQVSPGTFVVRGPYRWVRHPIYSAIIVLLWAAPELTPTRLELAILWTAWIYAGTRLEERDLVAEFGDIYREYSRRVPMLVPWRGPAVPPR
jgi:methanethiol S-methyltransferase